MRTTVLALACVTFMAPTSAVGQNQICEIGDPDCSIEGPFPEEPVYDSQNDCQRAISENRRKARGGIRGPQRCVLTKDGYVIV